MDRTFRISALSLFFVASALATAAGIWLSRSSPAFAMLPVLLFAGVAVSYGVFAAADGKRWAVALFVPVAIVVMSSSLRPVGAVDTGLDMQSFVKFGIFCMAFLIGVLALRYSYPTLMTPMGILLLLYAGWAAVTTIFSPIPAYTLAAAFGVMAWAVLAAAVCSRFSRREVLLILLTALSLFILISWPVYLFVPGLGKMAFGDPESAALRFTGLAATPNDAGQLAVAFMATLAAFYLSGFRFSPGLRVPLTFYFAGVTLLALGVLILSDSRGALLAFIAVGLSIMVQRTRSAPYAVLAILAFVFLLYAVPDPLELLNSLLVLFSRTGEVSELGELTTGRVDIWAAAVGKIQESPLFGFGYAASKVVMPEIYATRWGKTFSSAHNFLLQSMLDVGLVGTVLLLGLFVTCSLRYFLRPDYFRDSIFVLVLSTGLVESGISNSASVLIIVWFLSLFYGDDRGEAEPARPATAPEPPPRPYLRTG